MSIRMRHTKGHRNERRQHLSLEQIHATLCPKCKSPLQPHIVCGNCGTYRGRSMIDVLAKLTKKERKQKEKELKDKESNDTHPKQLTPETLSRK